MKYDWKDKINNSEIENISHVLLNGGIVIFPTETVYGIGASALSEKAINKVYKVKKRPLEKAVNIMVSDIEEIEKYAIIKNDLERKIIEKFMPGEITIILDKKDDFGKGFTEKDTIGVRIPNSKIALEILREVKMPLIVTSANISNHPSITNPDDLDIFSKSVDVIVDGGIIEKGIPSTIVRIDNDEICILREGKITKKQIENEIFR